MKPRVYIETTIISYLVGRLNRRDLYVAANQEFTRQWWAERKDAFHLYASVIVRDEAADGDATLASARLAYLDETTLLQVDADSEQLQTAILRDTGIPPKAALDALHIAIAAVNGMDYCSRGIAVISRMRSSSRGFTLYAGVPASSRRSSARHPN